MSKRVPASAIHFRTYTLLQEAIEGGLRGFFYNDIEPGIPEEQVHLYTSRATNRVMIELDSIIDFDA